MKLLKAIAAQRMRLGFKIGILTVLTLGVIAAFAFMIHEYDIEVLQPAGHIARQQRDLIVFASALSGLVIVPVFAMTFYIVWKYRISNTKTSHGAYRPTWHENKVAEVIWWGIPLLLITILGAVTIESSHRLDPFRAIDSTQKPIRVQVVALQWRWLFIYPEQNIATVNFLQLPLDRPVNFELTSDAPMNSFWIPKLGGQVYAMSGMTTKLHLLANKAGDYEGKSANISGEGYSDMTFTTRVSTQDNFDKWVREVRAEENPLTLEDYTELARPSRDTKPKFYSQRPNDLYDTVVMKYMDPQVVQGRKAPQVHEEHHE